MVYDSESSDRVYPTAQDDLGLKKILANEVLRLADKDKDLPSEFKSEWRNRIKLLTPDERREVYNFLLEEALNYRRQRDHAKSDISEVTAHDRKWYGRHISRLEKGALYLKRNFPFL